MHNTPTVLTTDWRRIPTGNDLELWNFRVNGQLFTYMTSEVTTGITTRYPSIRQDYHLVVEWFLSEHLPINATNAARNVMRVVEKGWQNCFEEEELFP